MKIRKPTYEQAVALLLIAVSLLSAMLVMSNLHEMHCHYIMREQRFTLSNNEYNYIHNGCVRHFIRLEVEK